MKKNNTLARDVTLLKFAAEAISRKNYALAIKEAAKVLSKYPNSFQGLFILGSAQLGERKVKQATETLHKAEKINPNNARLYSNLGACYNGLERPLDAIHYYNKALSIEPNFAQAHYNLGNVLTSEKRYIEAIASFSNAIENDMHYSDAYANLSLCLLHLKKYEDTVAVCDLHMKKFGLSPNVIVNKCKAIFDKGFKSGAVQLLENYILELPNAYELHTVLADMYTSIKRYEDAVIHFNASIDINPNEFANYNNLGILFTTINRHQDAITIYKKAIAVNPKSPIPHQNIATIYNQQRRYDLALVHLVAAYKLSPNTPYIKGMIAHSKIYTCDWIDLDPLIADIKFSLNNSLTVSNPFPPVAYLEDQNHLTTLAKNWVQEKCPESCFFPDFKSRKNGSVIRIGYFSADFHTHATALLMAGLLEQHDREKFELYAFSFGPDGYDDMSQRIRSCFDHFVDVRLLSDRAVAAYAREKNIDIAIDLKGFTQDSRTGIFAERVAPVQINYLGFPGSMGAPYIDYIVADDYVIPKALECHYTERVVRLPNCYQPNDDKREITGELQTRIEHGLPVHAIVLCSFNNNYKITPAVFSIWMRIMAQFPDTVLWLLKDNDTSQANLRKEAEQRGIDSNRLIFAPRTAPAQHLARHACADLFLDTYPCNAHTTASDALWADLPVVTCSGNSFASRVAGSLLTNVGLPSLITNCLGDYENKIVSLLKNPDEILVLKQHLRTNKMQQPLFNTPQYARDFEALLTTIYDQHFKQ